jgi:hypothetical protein
MLMLICTCGCLMNKLWFDVWKLIWWYVYVDLQMWLSNEQIVIQCLEPYSITCLCWFAHVDVKWTKLWFVAWMLIRWHDYVDLHVYVKCANYDSTLRSLFDNMSICTCRCQMNKLWFNTCKLIQHAYVNLQMLNEQIVHLTWILFPLFFQDEQIFVPCAVNTCSWDVEWTVSVKTGSKNNLVIWL